MKQSEESRKIISHFMTCMVVTDKMSKTHGMSNTRIYTIWSSMMARCYRRSHNRYTHYGGRGISVCHEWRTFAGFYAAMGASYRDGLTLDRIDTDGSYCPENCRWATQTEQQRNRTNNVLVRTRWGAITLAELSERTGIAYDTLRNRRRRGWPDERLAAAPKRQSSAKGGEMKRVRAGKESSGIYRPAEGI